MAIWNYGFWIVDDDSSVARSPLQRGGAIATRSTGTVFKWTIPQKPRSQPMVPLPL
ncbi:MAG TPA: hypothetical protein V6C88_20315 [Chroococcidiopsis sp.]